MTKNPPKLPAAAIPVKPAHVPRPARRINMKLIREKAKALPIAGARVINNTSTRDLYVAARDLQTTRAGADQFLAIPSRMGNTLRYRDGRAVHIDDNGSNT